jgi:WD40 repeat protein
MQEPKHQQGRTSMSSDTGCPSRECLASFLWGKLPPEQEEAIHRHLETCPGCQTQAEQLGQLTDPLVEALRDPAPTLQPDAGALPARARASGGGPHRAEPFPLKDYEILREVGRGGMGIVYQARQHRLNRTVAIKMILAGQLAGPEERLRFVLEGELLARLNHPNFVQVYEVGTVELASGAVQPYLVLEHVEGGSLKARLAEEPLPAREAARQLLVLARAMDVAHAQGIIHRDLKPANVLVARDGTMKIGDFGLAKEMGGNGSLTPTGPAIGTPNYMAPEQASGGPAVVGPAADVYALGAILYEMLSGRPPFEGTTPMKVLLQVLETQPTPPSRLRPGAPRDLETICLKCLEKEPGRRYARAADLAHDLECWLENRPISARPAGRVERVSKWVRRHPLPAALLLFLVLSLVLGSAASTYFGVSAVRRADEANKAQARAERATAAERWERYVAEIAAASNALQVQNIGAARRALEAAPREYRNWEWYHLHSQLDGARAVLRGHRDGVLVVDLSADGKRLASVSGESLRLWDAATGQELAARRPPAGKFRDLALSPDGRRLVTGGDRVRLWDVVTGALLWEAAAGKAEALGPVWSPDGRRLAGREADDRLRVRDAATGRVVFERPCERGRGALAFRPDGRQVAASQEDHTVRVWELATGQEVVVLRGHEAAITALIYSPDGRRIATGSIYPEDEVRLWDAATGAALGVGEGHANEVSGLAFSPDGRCLATGSMDQTVRLWDGATCRPRATLRGHTNFVNDLAFSPDGAHLVSASSDQTLRLWDLAAGRVVAVLRGHAGDVRRVKYGPGGGLIVSGSADHTVRLWDVKLAARNGVLRGHRKYVYDVAFRPDGGEVASAAWDGTVRLWEPTTGRETAVLRPGASILNALAYRPDGRQLAVLGRGGGVWVWDLARRKPTRLERDLASHWAGDTRVAFHPQGTLLAQGTALGPVRLWNPATGKRAGVLRGHKGCSRDVAFRPDGQQLASAGQDGTVRLWDLATGRTKAVLRGPPELYCLAYSADGRLLAAGGGDRTVWLWEVDTREQVGVLQVDSTVYGLAFSPDGTRLACACADNSIRLWDVARRREVADLRGHDAYVHAVMFSPDGTRLVSASGDFTVRVWDTLSAQDRAGSQSAGR